VKPEPEKKKPAPKKTPAKKKKTAQPEETTAPRPKLTAAEARAQIAEVHARREAGYQELSVEYDQACKKAEMSSQAHWDLHQRKYGGDRSKWTKEEEAQLQSLYDEWLKDTEEIKGILQRRAQYGTQTAKELRSVLAVQNPAKLTMITAGKPKKDTRATWEAGVDGFSQLVDDSLITAGSSSKPVFKSTRQQRSYFDPVDSTVNMYSKSGRATVVHELGHWLEEVNPAIRSKAVDFLERRTQGESESWLGSGYSSRETARRDKFLRPYMGKIYKDRNGKYYATEIVSMGLEYMYDDPYTLAKDDPDYFDFIYGLARGE